MLFGLQDPDDRLKNMLVCVTFSGQPKVNCARKMPFIVSENSAFQEYEGPEYLSRKMKRTIV